MQHTHSEPRAPTQGEQTAIGRATRRHDILDSGREEPFDAIVRAASRLMRAPTALISLLDVERQWFKARVGMDCSETPVEQSFCRFAVVAEQPLLVLDASRPAAFRNNPLVTEMGVRFYAGAPMRMMDGSVIGTVCVLDYAPRTACAPEDIAALEDLATATAEMISLRATARTLIRVAGLGAERGEGPAAA